MAQQQSDALIVIFAEKVYVSCKIRGQIADEEALAIIPSRCDERQPIPHDASLHARRNAVERLLCIMKNMRSLATRFEKLKRDLLYITHIFTTRCRTNCVYILSLLFELIDEPFRYGVDGIRGGRPFGSDKPIRMTGIQRDSKGGGETARCNVIRDES